MSDEAVGERSLPGAFTSPSVRASIWCGGFRLKMPGDAIAFTAEEVIYGTQPASAYPNTCVAKSGQPKPHLQERHRRAVRSPPSIVENAWYSSS